jgi:hypothetical protein
MTIEEMNDFYKQIDKIGNKVKRAFWRWEGEYIVVADGDIQSPPQKED